MPTPALLLLIAALLPLGSFTLLIFIGKRMGALAGWVATFFIGASLVCSFAATIAWFNGGQLAGMTWGPGDKPIDLPVKWLPVGSGVGQEHPGFLDVSIYIDSLTIAMFNMITVVALLVHVFSIGYMAGDRRFARYFTYLGLFCFSMLSLVLGGTLLQLFIFWELVGLCSYLLIGFWFEQPSASNAAIKAFITNRIGDVGFLIGFGLLFYYLGNTTLLNMDRWLGYAGEMNAGARPIYLPNGLSVSTTALTIMGIGIFFGAVGKSAQFPLHVWLPDAMEGPTPVSALIHAATMVAAGVYLVARIFPILTPDARLFIAVIGLVTLTMGALVAMVQSDIKRVLAFSTISQLGYMIMAMGIGSWIGGMFHLITHAFFKALLFLAAGSVIHAAGHEQELSELGGLLKKIPLTATTFAIGVLAISGVPGFSGYYSKDMILAHAAAFAQFATGHGHPGLYWAFFVLPCAAAYLTAFYMARCWMLAFWGKPRNLEVHEAARESATMALPLVALALMSIVGGSKLLDVQDLLSQSVAETTHAVDLARGSGAGNFTGFAQTWPVDLEQRLTASGAVQLVASLEDSGKAMAQRWTSWACAVGILLGVALYWRGFAVGQRLVRIWPLGWIHRWLYERMYFDELYFSVGVSLVVALSKLSALIDRYVIDGAVNAIGICTRLGAGAARRVDDAWVDGAVRSAATAAQELGIAARSAQTGRVRLYVTLLITALTAALAAAVFLTLH